VAIGVSDSHFSTHAAEDETWVTHWAHVTIRCYKVYVCVWPYLLEK